MLCSFNTPEEYEELKLEIFTERKISTKAVADIKLTEEEIQAIRKKTKERRQVFHSKTEKDNGPMGIWGRSKLHKFISVARWFS